MTNLRQLGFPENFKELLPNLKNKTLGWEYILYSGTELNTPATIKYYHSLSQKTLGAIVAIPGLASNSDIDPLTQRLSYWALTHKYNIITIDTFMGNFQPTPPLETTNKYHYSELTTILEKAINFVEPYTTNKYSCVIGHCASANGLIDTFNRRIKQHKPISFTSTLLFAPWPRYDDYLHKAMYKITLKFANTPVLTTHEQLKTDHFTFLLRMSHFIKEMTATPFLPEIMAQWGIKATFVSGKRDPISNYKLNNEKYNIIRNICPNFNHLILPQAKHDFAQIASHPEYIIKLIHDQRTKRTK